MPVIKRNYECDFPNLNLICESNIHLYDIEEWVLYSVQLKKIKNTSKIFELLDKYVGIAKSFYINDPVSYSRMVLVAIKLICAIDDITFKEQSIFAG